MSKELKRFADMSEILGHIRNATKTKEEIEQLINDYEDNHHRSGEDLREAIVKWYGINT